ncbi:hypothetical protein STENM223S_02234 [Streptomyces tendae]
MAVLTADLHTGDRRKCSASTMLTRAMSSSGYATESAECATLDPPSAFAAWASARLQARVSSEPPISQASRPRQIQPAFVTGRLASTRSPTMAGGAKHRKNRSA